MPRKYIRRGTRGRWTDLQLQAALKAVREQGASINAASKKFAVPKTTLFYHYTGQSGKRYGGSPTILTRNEEYEIMEYLQDLERPNPFSKGKPGNDWWLGFMRRWPTLRERKPQHLPASRASALTENAVSAWISKVSALVEEAGLGELTPDELSKRMWNCDETAFATDSASKKILARRGNKNIHETGGGSGRDYITVLGCGSANGERLPPYIVYKGKNLWTSWTQGGPAGTLYTVSASGWMERPHFLERFKKLFLPAESTILETSPVILFLDGHASHINLELIRLARDKGVLLFCLPSHTTHALQPLDVGAYGPVKSTWGKILKDYKMATCAAVVDKTEFPGLLRKLWEQSFQAHHLKAGFRKAGLCPISKEAIPKSCYAPSLPHTLASHEPHTPTHTTVQHSEATNVVSVEVTCCKCIREAQMTPMRVYLRGYFAQLIGRKKADNKKTARKRVKPLYSGEALTQDDIYERLEDDDRQKKEKERQKAARAKERQSKRKTKTGRKRVEEESDEDDELQEDAEHCQHCGESYHSDNEERQQDWIGCDFCWRWFHYGCAGLDEMPDENDEWKCPKCP